MYISDDVILHGWGQACSGIPKEAIKSFNISKTKRGMKLILYMQLHSYLSFKLIMYVWGCVVRHILSSPNRLLKL